MKFINLSTMALGALLATQLANAAPSNLGPLRLIQTSESSRQWMTQDQIDEISHRSHAQGHCGGFMDVTDYANEQPVYHRYLGVFDFREPKQHAIVESLLPHLSTSKLNDNVAKLSSYPNRYYNNSPTGVQAAEWIRDEFVRMAKNRSDVTVELFKHKKFTQPSVIVKVAGKGPHANEHVIIGAHEDSINWSSGWATPRDKAPGADDNASGVSTVLETFRVLMESGYSPDRTLQFMTYAGEEQGLLGSKDIAESYKKQGVNVVAVLQLDMTMYPGANPKIRLINDNTDSELTRFLSQLIDTYVKAPWVEMACGYGCSDHASWNSAGYPAAFPFEAPMESYNPKIHTANDTLSMLNMDFGLHFAKIATAFAVELATE